MTEKARNLKCNPTMLKAIRNANALANGVQAHYIAEQSSFLI